MVRAGRRCLDGVLAVATMIGRPIVGLERAIKANAGPGWNTLLSKTVEVRLSGGVVGLIAVVGIAALALTFQVGQHLGGRTGPSVADASSHEAPRVSSDGVSRPASSGMNQTGRNGVVAMGSLPLEPAEIPGGAVALPSSDPRAVGLNYFILTTVRPGEVEGVRQLQEFLAAHGVATFLDKANNGRLRVLVDVTRGFSARDLDSLQHAEHRHRIQALGQRYKKQNKGLGTDLSDIYLDRFDGQNL